MNKIWVENKIGVIALIFTIVGVIGTILPLMGWLAFLTLPVSFVLGIVSLVKRKPHKWLGITSIITSFLAFIANIILWVILAVGIFVFFNEWLAQMN